MKIGKKRSIELKKQVIGVAHICNTLSILIHEIEYGIDDSILWSYSNDDVVHKSKVMYKEDSASFRVGYVHYNLNEFLRV